MDLDQKGKDFLAKEEGLILHPYQDSKGVWTIGIGNTYYEDGTKVTMKDPSITKDRAYSLFNIVSKQFINNLNKVVKSKITQNQFDALFSLSYNIGITGFNGSTVLRLVNSNTNDLGISEAFKMWKKAGNDPTALLGRRIREVQLYFSK